MQIELLTLQNNQTDELDFCKLRPQFKYRSANSLAV
jgi:hypothetical protein